ncbi:MAG: 50S ribosomal protein L25 [Chitinophagales bacterium]
MKNIVIEASLRTDTGKKSTKALRRTNQVPCVLYGGKGNVHFSADMRAFKDLFYKPEFSTAEIKIDGSSYKAFVKASQFHPVSDKLLHVDFQELVPGQTVLTEIPIRLEGLALGVKAGGKLTLKLRKLKVKTQAQYLVPEIVLNVEHLELSKSVRVRDVKMEGLEFVNPPAVPIASVEITRALRAAAAAAGGEEA